MFKFHLFSLGISIFILLITQTIRPALALDCCGANALCLNGACSIDPNLGAVCTTQCVPVSGTNPDFQIPNYAEVGEGDFEFYPVSNRDFTFLVSDIIGRLLLYVFVIVGLLLFFYLIYGVFTMLSAFGNPQSISAGTTIITRALIGFVIVFSAYWIVQIIELVLGLRILN